MLLGEEENISVPDAQDEITRVLRLCEETLRTLSNQNRLSTGALQAFVQLSATVRKEMDRRRNPDRRETPRQGVDRRTRAPTPEAQERAESAVRVERRSGDG
jgi:hypothetical protein